MNAIAEQILAASDRLSERLAALPPVGDLVALDPTRYCRSAWSAYLRMAARPGCALVVGMNPGPHGMAQTGVPFTDPLIAQELLGEPPQIDVPFSNIRPVGTWIHRSHVVREARAPKARREESAKRLWGLMREICAPYCAEGPSADKVAEASRRVCRDVLLVNALPICWLTPAGKNVSAEEVSRRWQSLGLRAMACDWLDDVVASVRPSAIVGVGKWAQVLAADAWLGARGDEPGTALGPEGLLKIKHPSPLAGSEQTWRVEAEPVLRRAIDLAFQTRKEVQLCPAE